MGSLTPSQCTVAGPVYTGMPLECHWLIQCTLGYHWATQWILQWNTTGKTKLKLSSTGMQLKKLTIAAYTGTLWRDCDSPNTPRDIKVSRVASMPVWNDKMTGPQAASGQVSAIPAFTWSLLLSDAYEFCFSNMWILQHHSMHALDTSSIILFVYLRFQFKWNQLSSNNSRHSRCIHRDLQAGKWPDLITSKPDALSTLECHCTDCTGTILANTIAQWSSSANPVLICIIGTHWKTTGARRTLGCHWNHTGWCQHPVVSQWQSSVNLHNWNTLHHHWMATGRPLEAHWKLATNNSFSSGIPVYTGV